MSEFQLVSKQPLSSLEEACNATGVIIPKYIKAGGFRRGGTVKSPRGGDASINLFTDGRGGFVFNFQTHVWAFFFYDANGKLSRQEWAELQKKADDEMQKRAAEEAFRQARTRDVASAILKLAHIGAVNHQYVKTKHLEAVAQNLAYVWREDAQDVIGGYSVEQADGERQNLMNLSERLLVIPLTDEDGLCSLQFIDETGQKRFLKGGKKKGAVYFPVPVPEEPIKEIGIAEGVATALSVSILYGVYCVAGLDSGNLLSAAKHLREQRIESDSQIIFYADADESGTGQRAAEKAESATANAKIALPPFTTEQVEQFKLMHGGKKPKDFNDYLICLEAMDA